MKKSFNLTNPVADMIINDKEEKENQPVAEQAEKALEKEKTTKKDKNDEKKINRSFMISASLYREIITIVSKEKLKDPEKHITFTSVLIDALEKYVKEYNN